MPSTTSSGRKRSTAPGSGDSSRSPGIRTLDGHRQRRLLALAGHPHVQHLGTGVEVLAERVEIEQLEARCRSAGEVADDPADVVHPDLGELRDSLGDLVVASASRLTEMYWSRPSVRARSIPSRSGRPAAATSRLPPEKTDTTRSPTTTA